MACFLLEMEILVDLINLADRCCSLATVAHNYQNGKLKAHGQVINAPKRFVSVRSGENTRSQDESALYRNS